MKKIIIIGAVVITALVLVHKCGGEKLSKYCPIVQLNKEVDFFDSLLQME